MDILPFIDSDAIRNHLKEIDYQFSSLESAWLIYACKKLSYEKKRDAWNELINTMPDCKIPQRSECKGWSSLHEFLARYIDVIDKELEEFYSDEPERDYVYKYSYRYADDHNWTEEYETDYISMKDCLEAYRADTEDLDRTYHPEGGTGVRKYRLKKQSLLHPGTACEVECFSNGEHIRILRNDTRSKEAETLIDESFDGLWFSFPTPFKKGDIVWIPKTEGDITWDCDGGFVLLGIATWDTHEFIVRAGNASDMSAYGYFVNPDGTVYREVTSDYMGLEYYNGPYKSNERILPALSKFVKGEIEVDFLLCAYRKVLLDVAADDIMLKCWFSKDSLKELGVI